MDDDDGWKEAKCRTSPLRNGLVKNIETFQAIDAVLEPPPLVLGQITEAESDLDSDHSDPELKLDSATLNEEITKEGTEIKFTDVSVEGSIGTAVGFPDQTSCHHLMHKESFFPVKGSPGTAVGSDHSMRQAEMHREAFSLVEGFPGTAKMDFRVIKR